MIQKSEDKDSNTGGTVGVHVEDITAPEESTAPSGGASIVVHVLEASEQSSRLSRTLEEILRAHFMNDGDFWVSTNPGDVSIDTANSD